MSISRRRFLAQAGLFSWLGSELALDRALALGTPVVDSAPAASSEQAGATTSGILRLRLQARGLDQLRAFYGETMGWDTAGGAGSLTVQAGGTELRFDPAATDSAPFYHLAWAIPSNKFEQGKAWLASRTALLRHPDGRDEFHFQAANRRAVYFADPAGNILELIARDELGDSTPGPFTLRDLLYVNHVGLVVDKMMPSIVQLREGLGLPLRRPPTETFSQLGDSYRHLVLVTRHRLWLPEYQRGAQPFATEAVLAGAEAARLKVDGLPYTVAIAPR